jgi:hypothetical protein
VALRASNRTVGGTPRRLHGAFVISQIALSVGLLASAGMLAGTLTCLSSLNRGIDLHDVVIARVALSPASLTDPARVRAAWEEILNHAGHAQGVKSVALADIIPMREGENSLPYWATPAPPRPTGLPSPSLLR